ncbi:hypothetical protein [Sharpea azabuensis]|uniref:hypothetical protein n=1 Tax=Sharpea azabuensis TaxID=322505 RepID=UPI002E81C3ED|nr:hypothetical protein [Sharpea azabuensis]MEE3309630.1 hypothetical protein [Sharpea azabuensis]
MKQVGRTKTFVIMDKETALKILRELHDKALFSERTALETLHPELKESEDERIKKSLIEFVKQSSEVLDKQNQNNMIDWLEKQGDTSEIVNKKKIAPDILRGAAINLITWIDYNAAEGNMCLSNMECKDIEDALVSGNWGKIYAYIKKKLEKQGEQKPTAWSEEDEKNLYLITTAVEQKYSGELFLGRKQKEIVCTGRNLLDWLNSLKDRIGG